MRKMSVWLMLIASAVIMLAATAQADVHVGQQPPEDWVGKETLRVVAIDVERNDAMLISCGGEHMLVDAATAYYAPRVMEIMERYGVQKLKYLFSTHSDCDHIGGFGPLIHAQCCEYGTFLSPNDKDYKHPNGYHQTVMRAVNLHQVDYRVVEDCEQIYLGGGTLIALRCLENWGRNNRSACLSIRFGGSGMLLTGDIGAEVMKHFLDKYDPSLLKADVMKAPHHGIITIPEAFLHTVDPALIFVTNRPDRIHAYLQDMMRKQPGAQILFSAHGTIVMETDGQDWYVWQEEDWRQE